MHSRTLASGSAVAMAIALAGCSGSLLESKKIDYKSASAAPVKSLEIPPDLTAPTRDDRYTVPDVSPKGTATFSAYSAERTGQGAQVGATPGAAPTAASASGSDKMHIERAGSQRWLVVQGSADKLWPQIRDFWQESGFLLNVDKPEIGVMETDWAENRAKIEQGFIRNTLGKVLDGLYSTPERDKFRTRLEAGAEAGTVEIYISHRGMMEIYPTEGKDRTIWQPRAADPELEAEFLQRLMVRLGADESRAKAQLATAPSSDKARLANAADGATLLTVQDAFDRAWRRVGLALDRVGFTVEDRDRSQGLYYVRYVDPEVDVKKKGDEGLLSKLAFWRSDKPALPTGSQYRIFVKNAGDESSVQVLTREGGVDKSDSARKILGLLYEQLK
ncbi:MAG TPA: outer membrane protein assembly factor BamC [Zoogloea sp.]|uniref:outer membrane protein assembly factor BamC n=1 Tax=Zoogloea sp. TaxID=49181 RepID=UPI002C6EF8E2|nr:outer membrane protein assembly factor BamC [Zoogloea sp.]HMV18475.1 outer membrane protein assembly factor BamC [Rhodocyclaceae bacterium]HMV62376.1 outer membrane protein assembly factor BamC [Rhodocyclaceae bacterium]HMW50993.1 outer membrane protein assembly factor BamC [Rhodocyclaceae bacterium]HMY49117.1 outer membrane protein assembly factor BamC [Rhodocyclaceae bacterium]HMZ75642.1 outer membrane protein assembly factor BamC [Rhodocyclaceae bacterium]